MKTLRLILIDSFKSRHPFDLLLRLMFVGVSIILLGFAAWMTVDNLYVIGTYEKATAEVVESERKGPVATKGLNSYHVKLQYERDGRSKTTYLDRSNTNYEVGEVITIYFIPDTAYKAIAGDFFGMWFFVLVVAAPGFSLLFFALKPVKAKS